MIFTLLSSGRKNCWEGNEQVNQMFKNILKKKKKSHLELGQPIIEPKRKHTIPNNSARPLIYKQNLYGGHKKEMFWQPLPQDSRFLQKSREETQVLMETFWSAFKMMESGINAASKVKCQYRKDVLELWAIARAVTSPSSFQTIKRNIHFLKKKKTKPNKKILNNPTFSQVR